MSLLKRMKMSVGDNLKLFVLLLLCASRSQCLRRSHFPSNSSSSQNGVAQNSNELSNAYRVLSSDINCYDNDGVNCVMKKQDKKRHYKDDERSGRWPFKNFIATDYLPDGEKEVRIYFNGIAAKETSIVNNGSGLVLRQFSDGLNFMQTILNNVGTLIDCEYVDEESAVRDFFRTFRKEIKQNLNELKRKRGKNNDSDDETRRHRLHKHIHRDRSDVYDDSKNTYYNENYVESINRDDFNVKNEEMPPWNERDADMVDGAQSLRPNRTRRFKRQKWRRRRSRVLHVANGVWNVTFEELQSNLPIHVANWLDLKKTKQQCDDIHERSAQSYDDESDNKAVQKRGKRSLRKIAMMPGTLWCGAGQLAELYSELGPISDVDSCCRTHDHCKIRIGSLKHNYTMFNPNPFTISHCVCDKRSRRVVRSTMLVPGTRWCGKGSSGIKYNHLGEFSSTDRCCRMHDNACPFWINSMETKYSMFNWRPNTLMHCRCDERFRTCLKLANTDMANVVGKLFFNVVQTKCFVLKPHKICLERSWKGKCKKVGYAKKAYLRNNLEY